MTSSISASRKVFDICAMKSAISYIMMFVAIACIFAVQPFAGAELQKSCPSGTADACQIVEAINHIQGVAPNQNQLTVRICKVSQKLLFGGFFEVVKSSCKVFFNSYSSNKVNPVGFVVKYRKVDIPYPFSVFW